MKLEIKEFEVNREHSYRAYNPKIDDKFLKIISNGINKYFDAVINLLNTSKEDKEKYTDNLSNLFYFMFDEKDLLNILSLYTKKKLNKIDLIKTDMFGYINGKEYNVNYEIAINSNTKIDTLKKYSSYELTKMIEDKQIVLIRMLISPLDNLSKKEKYIDLPVVIRFGLDDIFDGFYNEFSFYKNNINKDLIPYLYDYIIQNINNKKINNIILKSLKLLEENLNYLNNFILVNNAFDKQDYYNKIKHTKKLISNK